MSSRRDLPGNAGFNAVGADDVVELFWTVESGENSVSRRACPRLSGCDVDSDESSVEDLDRGGEGGTAFVRVTPLTVFE